MLRCVVLLSLLSAALSSHICNVCCWPNEIFTQPAIGLAFGVDYGHAALKWANGTVHRTAGVPGSSEYVAYMLSSLEAYEARSDNIIRPADDSTGDYYSQFGDGQYVVDTKGHSFNEPIADLKATTDPLYEMANELKHQIGDMIPNPLPVLGLAYPFYLNVKQTAALRSAVKSAGFVDYLVHYETTTSRAASAGNRVRLGECPAIRELCYKQESKGREMILSVDFSDHALAILLYERMEPEKWKNGGISFLQAFSYSEIGRNQTLWDDVARSVRALLAEAMNHRIDFVVFSGENAGAPPLHKAIYQGLDDMQPLFLTSPGRLGITSIHFGQIGDPETAAVFGIAELSWRETMIDRICSDPCTGWKVIPGCPGTPVCL